MHIFEHIGLVWTYVCCINIYIYTYIYIWYMYLLLLWWWYRVVNCPQSLLWTGSACLLEHSGAGAGGGKKSLFWTLMLFGKNIESHSTDMLLQCRFGIGWKILAQGSVVVCRDPLAKGAARGTALVIETGPQWTMNRENYRFVRVQK